MIFHETARNSALPDFTGGLFCRARRFVRCADREEITEGAVSGIVDRV